MDTTTAATIKAALAHAAHGGQAPTCPICQSLPDLPGLHGFPDTPEGAAAEFVHELLVARVAALAGHRATAENEAAGAGERARAQLAVLAAEADPFDERDALLLAERIAARERVAGPREGDFVIYPTGERERIASMWGTEDGGRVQTTAGGSFHLGDCGGANFSGGLNPSFPTATLTDTGTTASGSAWFFHHGRWAAHNGVHAAMPCRVYTTTATVDHYRP